MPAIRLPCAMTTALSAAAILFEVVWADAVHVNNAVVSKAAARYLVMFPPMVLSGLKSTVLDDRVMLSVQEHDENDQRNRNSDEPKQNWHGISPFVFEWLAIDRGGVSLLAPGSVAEAATFGCRERCGERADEQ